MEFEFAHHCISNKYETQFCCIFLQCYNVLLVQERFAVSSNQQYLSIYKTDFTTGHVVEPWMSILVNSERFARREIIEVVRYKIKQKKNGIHSAESNKYITTPKPVHISCVF